MLDKEKRQKYDQERQILQEQYINYIANLSFKIEKKEEKQNNKKTFSDVLNELIDKNKNNLYNENEENIYKKDSKDISEQEKKIINNYEKAKKIL
ncbi:MAG: hypothetical protein KatS3mg068_0279 [Candidatus Sericytochromatia bacterium]|nr:MAG: hypothetical protein KatS3mg068_0279 [Candidatus Sericytochromatia bacterium]